MDSTQRQVMKADPGVEDESGSRGFLIAGAVPLIIGGVLLLLQGDASVAQFGGAILALIGLALLAAAVWLQFGWS